VLRQLVGLFVTLCYRSCSEPVHQLERPGTATGDEAGHQEENDNQDNEFHEQTVR
jgi:hypothetical protein